MTAGRQAPRPRTGPGLARVGRGNAIVHRRLVGACGRPDDPTGGPMHHGLAPPADSPEAPSARSSAARPGRWSAARLERPTADRSDD